MSKMTVRKASNRLCMLLERKPEFNQPGRLTNHLMEEMRLSSSERRNSAPIIETALDRLEERGIVKLGKSGDNVYNSVIRIKSLAERREEASPKQQSKAVHAMHTEVPAAIIEPKEVPVTENEPMEIPEILQSLSQKVLEKAEQNQKLTELVAERDEEIRLQFEQIERAHVQVTEATQKVTAISQKLESAQEHIKEQKRKTEAAETREDAALEALKESERQLEEARAEIEELKAEKNKFNLVELPEQIARAMAS